MRYPFSLLLLVPFLGTGCDQTGPENTHSFHVDTLANGIISVVNDGSENWPTGNGWKAEEDLRIGVLEGEAPYQLAVPSGIAVDELGRILVAEAQAHEVRVFDGEGKHSFSFGQKGEGPGEFQTPYGIKIDSDGRVWVRDARNMRYSVHSSEGEFLFVHPIRLRSALPNWQAQIDPAGRLVDWSVFLPYRFVDTGGTDWDPDARSTDEIEFIPIRITPGVAKQDSLGSIWQRIDYISGTRASKPFSGTLVLHMAPDLQIWMADSKVYRIFRRGLEGDTTLAFSLPAEPDPVTSEERVAVSSSWLSGRRVPFDQIPEEKPVVECITSDDDGHILVFPHVLGVEQGTALDVFEESGVYLGRVSLPIRIELRPEPVVKGGRLYAITKDEMDVPYVVRFRLGSD